MIEPAASSLAVEIAANGLNAVSIVLAGRNSVHTWWTGIVGCLLFAWLFFGTKLYADTTLQFFFVATSVAGWRAWASAKGAGGSGVRRTEAGPLVALGALGILVTLGYAWLLHRFTDAYAPLFDSAVLAFSVLGQFLLMSRRIETWPCWLIVNSIAVPLYLSRELYLTAALYAGFWLNAVISLRHWRKILVIP